MHQPAHPVLEKARQSIGEIVRRRQVNVIDLGPIQHMPDSGIHLFLPGTEGLAPCRVGGIYFREFTRFSVFQNHQADRGNVFLQGITQIDGYQVVTASGYVQGLAVCLGIGLKVRQQENYPGRLSMRLE